MAEQESHQAAAKDGQQPEINVGVGEVIVGSISASSYADPKTILKLRQDLIRSIIALTFVAIFALTIILAFMVVILFNGDWATTKDLLQLLFPAETALIGSAVGFYFGAKTAESDRL